VVAVWYAARLMIRFLDGILESKQPTRVEINVGGVGYEVFIPLTTYDRLPSAGERCRLLVHEHIREDAHQLFGFVRDRDRDMFVMLLGITGIGPKIALSALSGLSAREIKAAVVEGDTRRLSTVPGIGRKMAERMVVELRHKIGPADALEATAGAGEEPGDLRLRDTVLALVALGYKQIDAQKLARRAMERSGPEESVDNLIKKALTQG
jgi:Holliday junction DNA helicase RuvA